MTNEYIQITVGGKTHYLLKQPDGAWLFTQREPIFNGMTPEIVNFTIDDGTVTVGTNDERLAKAVGVYVSKMMTPMGNRMINYYPKVISDLLEYQALMQTLGFEIDFFRSEIILAFNDAFLTTMGEERIVQWEKALGLTPNDTDTLGDRRDAIIGRFRGGYKLNTSAINSIVDAFTGGNAQSYFKDSTITIYITPPPNNKKYSFPNVERELSRRIPAHLKYKVLRKYSSWNELAEDFTSWNNVKSSFTDWEMVKLYVRPLK